MLRQLWHHPALRQARLQLASRDDDIVREQIAVSEIAAPTGEENERAQWVAQRFDALKLSDVRIDQAGNVIGRRRGKTDGPPVLVCAHLDTVFPRQTRVSVARLGNRLAGPGIGDNGRGVAAMLALASAVDGETLVTDRPVDFIGTTGEEGAGDLRGAKHYFASAAKPFAVIALDGAGDERIVNTALGARRFRISYRGPGGHSWAAFGSANPVQAAARTATGLANLRLSGAGRASLTVSRIGGGKSINSIPEDAWLEVDVRSTSDAMLARYESEIGSVAQSAAVEENNRRVRGTAQLTVEVERIGERPSGQTTGDSALVLAAVEATRLVGRAPDLAMASTDANAAIAIGVPAIAIGGGGRGGGVHSSHEWFDNTAAAAGVERALTIVATMARLAAD